MDKDDLKLVANEKRYRYYQNSSMKHFVPKTYRWTIIHILQCDAKQVHLRSFLYGAEKLTYYGPFTLSQTDGRHYVITNITVCICRTTTEHKTNNDEHQRMPFVPCPSSFSGQGSYVTKADDLTLHFFPTNVFVMRRPTYPSKHTICVEHLYNVGPTSNTLGRHCTNVIHMLCVC